MYQNHKQKNRVHAFPAYSADSLLSVKLSRDKGEYKKRGDQRILAKHTLLPYDISVPNVSYKTTFTVWFKVNFCRICGMECIEIIKWNRINGNKAKIILWMTFVMSCNRKILMEAFLIRNANVNYLRQLCYWGKRLIWPFQCFAMDSIRLCSHDSYMYLDNKNYIFQERSTS